MAKVAVRSKITGGETVELFTTQVLNKHKVSYFKCIDTGFIQTEEPFWLDEAYSSAITTLDIGLIGRNLASRNATAALIDSVYDRKAKFIDFGGGYGMFVRMMRDWGYNFFRSDPYCQNLFANHFDWQGNADGEQAELLTAWEVFEHLVDPVKSVEEMLTYSQNILFSTLLVPSHPLNSPKDWWYFIPETGQHVSLYTQESLHRLGARFGLRYFTDGTSLHLFTKKNIANPFRPKIKWLVRKLLSRIRVEAEKRRTGVQGLQSQDYRMLSEQLQRS